MIDFSTKLFVTLQNIEEVVRLNVQAFNQLCLITLKTELRSIMDELDIIESQLYSDELYPSSIDTLINKLKKLTDDLELGWNLYQSLYM